MRFAAGTLFLMTSQMVFADGPFGVELGADPSSFQACKQAPERPGQFLCTTLPKTHANFEIYVLAAAPSTGVCGVAGMGHEIRDNGFGDQLRSAADELAKQVALTYGAPISTADFIQPGSLWGESSEWTMAVRQQERFYEFVWQSPEGQVLANNVKAIKLDVSAISRDEGSVNINFQFRNYPECLAEMRAIRSKAF